MYFINTKADLPNRYDIAKFLEYVIPDSGGPLFDVLASYFWNNLMNLPIGGTFTVIGEGNRPDLISYRIYGDIQYYWIIMLYNGITNNEDIQIGTILYYPLLKDLDNLYFQLNSLQTAANAAEALAALAPAPAATLSTISVTPADASIAIGRTQQYAASGVYSDGATQDISTRVTWSSSTISVATINVNGLVTAVSVGTTEIIATLEDVSGGVSLLVTTTVKILQLIYLSPAGRNVYHGTVMQFSASGVFSDGNTIDLTTLAGVVWDISDHAVATVSSIGLVTTLTAGSITITATYTIPGQDPIVGATSLTVT